jgi:transcriptional regulator with XRE-family HTH domain
MSDNIIRGKNHIHAMRKHRSLLQKHLSCLLGHRTHRRISHYESGSSYPPFETALLLEIALGVKLADLYPDLYQQLQALALKRAQHLPLEIRRALTGRLLNQDIPHEHT